MLRSTLCLLFTAMLMSAAWAQQGHTDVQSLQYEFGKDARVQKMTVPAPQSPCDCEKPVVYAPIARSYCYPPCYNPCYSPCYYPARYRHVCVRPVYCSPRYCW